MAITIYGPSFSSYVRSVRILCEEKGLPYELSLGGESNPIRFRRRVASQLHPFGRIPILEHDGFRVVETSAILSYLDRAFPETSFSPSDVRGRALMEQWMSAAHAYFDRPILRELLLPMRDAQRASEEFDFAAHRDSLDEARRAFEALDELLRDRHYICGEAVSLADFLMLPILNYARLLPPAEQWFGGADALTRWLSAMESRPSFVAASGS